MDGGDVADLPHGKAGRAAGNRLRRAQVICTHIPAPAEESTHRGLGFAEAGCSVQARAEMAAIPLCCELVPVACVRFSQRNASRGAVGRDRLIGLLRIPSSAARIKTYPGRRACLWSGAL